MSSVINLRLARKRKAREDAERLAAENRAVHGRSKAEKLHDRQEAERTATFLDSHRVDRKDESQSDRQRTKDGGKA